MKSVIIATISSLVLIGASTPIFADDIQFGIVGEAKIGPNLSSIDFGNFPSDLHFAAPPGTGTFEVSQVDPGYFQSVGITPGEFGHIQSLTNQTGNITLSGPFMTFETGASTVALWATNIPAGTSGPFLLQDSPLGAFVAFDVSGYVTDTTNPALDRSFTGVFAMTFDGTTVEQLSSLQNLSHATPFSATLSSAAAAVPEPGSLLLLGAGFVGLGAFARRKMSKS